MVWETPAEQLKLLRPVEYNAPSGHFDDTAEGKPGPMPLLEEEGGELRMREWPARAGGENPAGADKHPSRWWQRCFGKRWQH